MLEIFKVLSLPCYFVKLEKFDFGDMLSLNKYWIFKTIINELNSTA